jgi:hypothetical protein
VTTAYWQRPIPDLLERIYHFYPRGLWTGSPGYDDTAERHRQVEAVRRAGAEHPKWRAMLKRLRSRFTITDRSLHILGGTFDSAYTGQIEIPEEDRALLFHASFLGPYYVVHRIGLPADEPYAQAVAREIEATYRYEAIPPEIGTMIVPDLALDTVSLGKATIYDLLLSTVRGIVR